MLEGQTISPVGNTGMFWAWQNDNNYFIIYNRVFLFPFKYIIKLKFTAIPWYTVLEDVYQTAQTLGDNLTINLSYNLTWQIPVDYGIDYLSRLHFYKLQLKIIEILDKIFYIFIANQSIEEPADMIKWSGGNGVPVYKNYAISKLDDGSKNKVNLLIIIGAIL